MTKKISVAAYVLILMTIPILFVCSDATATVYSSISGRVIAEDTGQGVSGVSVLAVNLLGTSQIDHYAITDTNGVYVFRDIEPGTYNIIFQKTDSAYLFGFQGLTIALPVGKNVVNANYVVKLGGGLSGAVYDSDGVTPLSEVWVSARIQDSQLFELYGFKVRLTDTNGRFLLQGLPQTDSCIVQVSVPGHAVLSKTVRITGGGTTDRVDFLLKRDDITGITGQVTSLVDNKPIREVEVVLRDTWDNDIGNAYTDATGTYSIIGVPPGVYKAVAYWPTGEFDNLYKTNITITKGAQCRVDFQFNAPSPLTSLTEWMKNLFASFLVFEAFASPTDKYPKLLWSGCNGKKDEIINGFNRVKQWVKDNPCFGSAMRQKLKKRLGEPIGFMCKECSANGYGFSYGVGSIYVGLCKNTTLSNNHPKWCLESTILHELVHSVLGEGTIPYKCQKACFPDCPRMKKPEFDRYKGCKCE